MSDLARRLAEAALMYLDKRGELANGTPAAYAELERALARELVDVLHPPADGPRYIDDPRYEHGLSR